MRDDNWDEYERLVLKRRFENWLVESKAYAAAAARGLVPGARVRIIGPDSHDDTDAIGSTGHISYTRGPWESWVYVDAWDGMGTTFPNESLEACTDV